MNEERKLGKHAQQDECGECYYGREYARVHLFVQVVVRVVEVSLDQIQVVELGGKVEFVFNACLMHFRRGR